MLWENQYFVWEMSFCVLNDYSEIETYLLVTVFDLDSLLCIKLEISWRCLRLGQTSYPTASYPSGLWAPLCRVSAFLAALRRSCYHSLVWEIRRLRNTRVCGYQLLMRGWGAGSAGVQIQDCWTWEPAFFPHPSFRVATPGTATWSF